LNGMAIASPLSAAVGSSSSSRLLAGPIMHLRVTASPLVTAVTFSNVHRTHGFIKNPDNLKNTICLFNSFVLVYCDSDAPNHHRGGLQAGVELRPN
jgi:hypothetical protein